MIARLGRGPIPKYSREGREHAVEVSIYQMFNPYEATNIHLWTGDLVEYDSNEADGWAKEGAKWNAVSISM